jgi:hypothetical protein
MPRRSAQAAHAARISVEAADRAAADSPPPTPTPKPSPTPTPNPSPTVPFRRRRPVPTLRRPFRRPRPDPRPRPHPPRWTPQPRWKLRPRRQPPPQGRPRPFLPVTIPARPRRSRSTQGHHESSALAPTWCHARAAVRTWQAFLAHSRWGAPPRTTRARIWREPSARDGGACVRWPHDRDSQHVPCLRRRTFRRTTSSAHPRVPTSPTCARARCEIRVEWSASTSRTASRRGSTAKLPGLAR